jgi:uncharacterized protein YbaP (TraB family)
VKPVLRLCGVIFATLLLATTAIAGRAPVFEVSRGGDLAGYLVGTMHSDDPRVLRTMGTIEPLLDRVEMVAIELVPDGVAMVAVGAATLLPADQELAALVGQARFAALSTAAAARGLEPAMLNRLKPWAAAVLLGTPSINAGEVLDMAIYLAAGRRGLAVVGLETAADQIAVFDAMAPATQMALLDAFIKNHEHLPMHLEELTHAYLSGDLRRVMDAARSQYDAVPPSVQGWFEAELLERRNDRMLRKVDEILQNRRVLVAVGAMHLGGRTGLIDGLLRRGYRIRPLQPGL